MSTQPVGPGMPARLVPSVLRWKQSLKAFGVKLRVAMPGVIQSFDPLTQTCTVLPAISELVRINNNLTTKAIPVLADVPVLILRAGGFALTFPITKGDECLVIFLDQCMDAWWQSGIQSVGGNDAPQPQLNLRRHNLSDAVALVGIQNQTDLLEEYSVDSAQLRSEDGETVIDLADGQVTVTGATVAVNSTGTVQVSAQNVQISAIETCTINAATIDLIAQTALNLTAPGGSYPTHLHSAVVSGGATSGPIVPGS